MYKIITITFFVLFIFSCTKVEKTENNNNPLVFYEKFHPPLVLDEKGEMKIDIDKDKKFDFQIKLDSFPISGEYPKSRYGVYMIALSDSLSCNIEFLPSGERLYKTGHIIDDLIDRWYTFLVISDIENLYDSMIDFEYIAIKKNVNNNITYGWMLIDKSLDNIKLYESYYCKDTMIEVKAGIVQY